MRFFSFIIWIAKQSASDKLPPYLELISLTLQYPFLNSNIRQNYQL